MMADSSVPANYSGDHHSRNRSGSVGSVGSSGSGYIPGNESYGKKSGFFHNVKKALSGSKEKHPSGVVDVSGTPTNPELPGFSHGFQGLTQDTNKLKQLVYQYHTHLNGLLSSGEQITKIFTQLLHSTDEQHVSVAHQLAESHHALISGESAHSAEEHQQFKESIAAIEFDLDNQTEYHNQIQNRINHRNHIGSEVEYYAKKFEGLQADRQKRAAAGKVEKPEMVEKHDRNQRKLTDVRQEYLDSSAATTEELRALLNNRGQVYARMLLSWSNAERAAGSILKEANRASEGVNVPEAVPIGPPSSVTVVRSNVDYAPVNQEMPAIEQTTATAVTSGQTRATDGSELLAKNQVVQPPDNADKFNVEHGYGQGGAHQGTDATITKATLDPEEAMHATATRGGDSGISGPTNVSHDHHVEDADRKLTNTHLSGTQQSGTSYDDLQEQVMQSLNGAGVQTSNTSSSDVNVKAALPTSSSTVIHENTLKQQPSYSSSESYTSSSVNVDDRPSAVPTEIPSSGSSSLKHSTGGAGVGSHDSQVPDPDVKQNAAGQDVDAHQQPYEGSSMTGSTSASTSTPTGEVNEHGEPTYKRVINSILG